jgi:uncharacterized surface protein with fasciclin (FAS1) repeats
MDDENSTICEYLRANQEEYSKFCRLLEEGEMMITLCGYNPNGDDYTLFLPTNEAVDEFIRQQQDYTSFEELLLDTSYVKTLTRYHTVNSKVHTNEFPYGALKDKTLTGDRLTMGFYTDRENPLYKVNNVAPIIQSNLEMTNGYIHVVSAVLPRVEISGYDWLQQQDQYSILAQAMELSEIRNKLWWDRYTILAEPDTVYQKYGIYKIEDLIDQKASPGIPFSDATNNFYQFVAYHILRGEFYLNDLYMGNEDYRTLGNDRVTIDVGLEIRINPGIDTFRINISETGDTTVIDYIPLIWDECNMLSKSGPVHAVSELLIDEPWP